MVGAHKVVYNQTDAHNFVIHFQYWSCVLLKLSCDSTTVKLEQKPERATRIQERKVNVELTIHCNFCSHNTVSIHTFSSLISVDRR